jgi:hypothetical protein
VLERDRGDRFWNGEDHMEVRRVEQVRLTSGDPRRTGQRLTPGAMTIPARVEPDTPVAAVIALLHMSAQRSRPALLNRRHDAALPGQATRPLHGSLVHRVTRTLSWKEPAVGRVARHHSRKPCSNVGESIT